MSKKKEAEGVYLAELDVYGYSLTAVGRTRNEAIRAIRDSYYEGAKKGYGLPEGRSFSSYAKYAGLYVHRLPFGECEWL